MLDYQGIVIRPPSESDSLILQVTLGCSDNRCIFCPAYKNKKFKIKSMREIEKEIETAAFHYPEIRRVFLADGDALIIGQKDLLQIFDKIIEFFPLVSRISLYASAKSVELKTVQELQQLKSRKMSLVYTGFETGDDEIYKFTRKYGSPQKNIEAVLKLKQAGIKSNVTVILGLGGQEFSSRHAQNTARVLNMAQPEQIAALTLMLVENTPLYEISRLKQFIMPDEFGILNELKILLQNLQDFKCLFFSNHASNYIPFQARFPKDKSVITDILNKIITESDRNVLKKNFMRRL